MYPFLLQSIFSIRCRHPPRSFHPRNLFRRSAIITLFQRLSPGARLLTSGFIVFLGLTVAAPALAQLGGQVRSGDRHQDWQVLCEQLPGGAEGCFISQAIVDEDNDPVMQVSVGPLEGETAMVIYLPLGIDLRPGILFRVGDRLQREFRFQVCLPQGCRVIARVDEEMLTAMRAGSNYQVAIRPFGSEQVGILEGSLMGFTAGLRAVSR